MSAALAISALLPRSVMPYLILMAIGFFVGGYGHLVKSRVIVAIGVALIFLATLVLPLAIIAFDDSPAPPGPNLYSP